MKSVRGLIMAGLALLMTVAPASTAFTVVDEGPLKVECLDGVEDPLNPPPPPWDVQGALCTASVGVVPVNVTCAGGEDAVACGVGMISFEVSEGNFDEGDACGFAPLNCIEAEAVARGDARLCTGAWVRDHSDHADDPHWHLNARDCPVWFEPTATALNWLAPGELFLRNVTTGETRSCEWTLEGGCTVEFPGLKFLDISEFIYTDGSGASSDTEVIECSETDCIIESCFPGEWDVWAEDTLGNTVAILPSIAVEGCYRMTASTEEISTV